MIYLKNNMKRQLILFIGVFLFVPFALFALVNNEIPPAGLNQLPGNTIIVFPFNARFISDKHTDYLALSDRLRRDLITAFKERTSVLPVEETRIIAAESELRLEVVEGKINVQDYNRRTDGARFEESVIAPPDAGMRLSGVIEEVRFADLSDDDYIRVTFHLTDVDSRKVYWSTTMEGNYGYVVRTIAVTIGKRSYAGPSDQITRSYGWVDPKYDRFYFTSWGVDFLGIHVPLAELHSIIPTRVMPRLRFGFDWPLIRPLEGSFNIGILPSVDGRDLTYSRYFILPFNITLSYDLPFIPVDNLGVYPWLEAGFLYEIFSYPGLPYMKDPLGYLTFTTAIGAGVEYKISRGTFRLFKRLWYYPEFAPFLNTGFGFFGFESSEKDKSLRASYRLEFGVKLFLE